MGATVDKPFISDHCSAVPERGLSSCCVEHDWLYWQGGSWRDRKKADRLFRECMLDDKAPKPRAWLRWAGVRVGGVGLLPTSWRWGYGWPWPRCRPRRSDNSKFTVANQQKVYDVILDNAREADKLARG
jgi:hypothetical protein